MWLAAVVALAMGYGVVDWQLPAARPAPIIGVSPLSPRTALLQARRLAYDSTFRNDKIGLLAAIAEFDRLSSDPEVSDYASYYAGWARWSLAGSQWQDRDLAAVRASLNESVTNLRTALQKRPEDVEVITALANSLISIGGVDPAMWKDLGSEIMTLRRRALQLSPKNPRVVIMDAGLLFWSPKDVEGKEKGVARWREGLRLFDQETSADPGETIRPNWGRALAYGWLANLYLLMDPPRRSEAREMAKKALALRPDFWYVTTQVLPRVQ